MKITVSFNLTQQKLYDWATYYNQRAYSKLETFGIAGFGLMIAIANLVLPGASKLLALVGLLYAAMPFVTPKLLARRASANAGSEQFMQYEIDDEKISMYSGSQQAAVPWKDFRQWGESPDAFYIVVRRFKYLIVPKCSFKEPAQADEFREFLQSKLKKLPWK